MQKQSLALALAAVIAFGGMSAWAQGAPAQNAARTVGLQRITLLVSNIDQAVDFYQRAGLIKASDTTSSDTDQGGVYGAVDMPLTADSKRARLTIMQNPDGRGQIGLLFYDSPPLPSARGNLVGVGLGDVIIGIEVTDIQGAYSRLGQIGTRFQRTPVRFTQTGADGSQQTGQHFLAFDPDGHLVEISQMDRR